MIGGDEDDLPDGGTETEDQDDTELEDQGAEPADDQEEVPAQGAEPVASTPHKQSPAEVIRALRARAQQAELKLAAQEAVRQAQPAPQVPYVDPVQRAAEERRRLEDMPDVDRALYIQNQVQQQTQAQLQHLRFEMQMEADKRAFREELASNPEAKVWEADIEAEFNRRLAAGDPRSRVDLLENYVGHLWRTGRGAAIAKARKTAAKTVQRETTVPARARSGVEGGERKSQKSAEETLKERLEGGVYWQ